MNKKILYGKYIYYFFLLAINIYMLYIISISANKIPLFIKNNYIEILFLIITGQFLYSFKYEIFNMQITFNTFIIYTANNILKKDYLGNYFIGIEFIFLFILIFFFIRFIQVFLFNINKTTWKTFANEIVNFLSSSAIWFLMIIIFNLLLTILKIKLRNIQIYDAVLILLLIASHCLIKTILMYGQKKVYKKYYSFTFHSLPYFYIDSLFIFFSVILGSIYNMIGLLNTSLLIVFMSIGLILLKQFATKESKILSYYSLLSMIPKNIPNKNNNYLELPVYKSLSFNHSITNNIKYLTIVVCYNGNIIPLLDNQTKYTLTTINNKYICTVLTDIDNINDFKKSLELDLKQNFKFCHCNISRKYWDNININYIVKILIKNLNNDADTEINENYIFT